MKNLGEKLSVGLLFDDTLDSSDGVAQQVKRLGEYFIKNGHRVVYLCGQSTLQDWAGGKVYSLSRNLGVKFNGNRLSMPVLSRKKLIKRVLEKEKLDVVHAQMPYSPLMAQRVIKLAHKNSAIIATFHILPSGWLSKVGTRLLKIIQLRSLKKIDSFISVSASAAQFSRKTMGVESVVIPNMVDISKFKTDKNISVEPGKIVFLGRLVKRKGCEQLIRAFAKLAEDDSDAFLAVAGNGPDRLELERLVRQLKLKDRVSFLGFVDEEDKPRLLASAEIACFPSLYGESFGIVLIEAMAAGAGVILAGDNPGYRCVIGEQPDLLVDPTDSADFARKLKLLRNDTALRQRMHQWQASHVKQYDVNVVGKQVENVYFRTIAKRSKTIDN